MTKWMRWWKLRFHNFSSKQRWKHITRIQIQENIQSKELRRWKNQRPIWSKCTWFDINSASGNYGKTCRNWENITPFHWRLRDLESCGMRNWMKMKYPFQGCCESISKLFPIMRTRTEIKSDFGITTTRRCWINLKSKCGKIIINQLCCVYQS